MIRVQLHMVNGRVQEGRERGAKKKPSSLVKGSTLSLRIARARVPSPSEKNGEKVANHVKLLVRKDYLGYRTA